MKSKQLLIGMLCVVLVSGTGCDDRKDNSSYFPDFSWNDGPEDDDPVTETSVRLATYNLLVATGTDWTVRRDKVAELIEKYDFEVAGFEEASWEQRSFLGERLGGAYEVIAYGRDTGKDEASAGEMSMIAYKKDRFVRLDAGRFWFSETPGVPSSGWNETGFKRFCVWGKLKDRKTQKEFYVFKSHMPLAQTARKNACRMLVDSVRAKVPGGTPAFCMGDFNTTPETEEIASIVCGSGILADSYREAAERKGPGYTFPSKKTRIDFIFVKEATVLFSRVIDSPLSDHYPVVIVAEMEGRTGVARLGSVWPAGISRSEKGEKVSLLNVKR